MFAGINEQFHCTVFSQWQDKEYKSQEKASDLGNGKYWQNMIATQDSFRCPSGISLYKFCTFLPFTEEGSILMCPIANNLNEY